MAKLYVIECKNSDENVYATFNKNEAYLIKHYLIGIGIKVNFRIYKEEVKEEIHPYKVICKINGNIITEIRVATNLSKCLENTANINKDELAIRYKDDSIICYFYSTSDSEAASKAYSIVKPILSKQ